MISSHFWRKLVHTRKRELVISRPCYRFFRGHLDTKVIWTPLEFSLRAHSGLWNLMLTQVQEPTELNTNVLVSR